MLQRNDKNGVLLHKLVMSAGFLALHNIAATQYPGRCESHWPYPARLESATALQQGLLHP
jgi:hypothetical protein